MTMPKYKKSLATLVKEAQEESLRLYPHEPIMISYEVNRAGATHGERVVNPIAEAFANAAQKIRYYLKHQNYPSDWSLLNNYQRGVTAT